MTSLAELDQAAVRITEICGAPPGVVARLDEKRESSRAELIARAVDVADGESEVILVRRLVSERRPAFVDEELRGARGEDRPAGPLDLRLGREEAVCRTSSLPRRHP